MSDVFILGAARTAMGGFQGALASATAPELGATAMRAVITRADVDPDGVDEAIMGCVLPAGLGQAPARQAALGAGLPLSMPCTTVNKMCGSGMKAVMQARDAILAGSAETVVAGGMESMTNAPYLLPKARGGLRMGHGAVLDHMFLDGLEDAYDKGRLMGTFAEDCARQYGFTRQAQDDFAIESLRRARQATKSGAFAVEIAAHTIRHRKGETIIDRDEQPFNADPAKIRSLRPAFARDGTVTAGSSSSISDGAAALVIGRRPGLARIVAIGAHAQEPALFTTAPVGAIKQCLDRAGWRVADVDLWEINEAFAVVTMAAMHECGLDPDRVNINGGACALGHPIGASGARILVTLLHALQASGGKRGVASLCIGGGEATAVAIETV